MIKTNFSEAQIKQFADAVIVDGYCIIRDLFDQTTLKKWNEQFLPLLDKHIEHEGHLKNRGSSRYYVTLPFDGIWNDATIYEHPTVLAVVEQLVGKDFVMCQLATDTPLRGSDFQAIHRDTPPLFPEWQTETPPFQLAVNFALCDVTLENGPIEIAKATHMLPRDEALALVESGEKPLEPVPMRLGDVMIRDVRGLHRGTPNNTDVPRPMVVIGYSRRWLFRPEVSIRIAKDVKAKLSERARHMLRFNPVVDSLEDRDETEVYQAFAY